MKLRPEEISSILSQELQKYGRGLEAESVAVGGVRLEGAHHRSQAGRSPRHPVGRRAWWLRWGWDARPELASRELGQQ